MDNTFGFRTGSYLKKNRVYTSVTKFVEKGCVVAGVPAKIISHDGKKYVESYGM